MQEQLVSEQETLVNPLELVSEVSWLRRARPFAERFDAMLRGMTRQQVRDYVNYYGILSRTFAGAGLCLAGLVHMSPRTFGDLKSSYIASDILAALVDEFIARDGARLTHRELCDVFVTGVNEWCGESDSSAADATAPALLAVQDAIAKGYTVHAGRDDSALLRGIGFHLATEMNGAIEFYALDRAFREQWPDMVAYLRARPGLQGDSYEWIAAHVVFEQEHFAAAQKAVEQAIDAYQGSLTREQARELVQAGVDEFYELAETYLLTVH